MGFETNSHEDDINDLDGTYGDDDILHRHCGLYKIRQLLRKPFVKHLGWYCFYRVSESQCLSIQQFYVT